MNIMRQLKSFDQITDSNSAPQALKMSKKNVCGNSAKSLIPWPNSLKSVHLWRRPDLILTRDGQLFGTTYLKLESVLTVPDAYLPLQVPCRSFWAYMWHHPIWHLVVMYGTIVGRDAPRARPRPPHRSETFWAIFWQNSFNQDYLCFRSTFGHFSSTFVGSYRTCAQPANYRQHR